MIAQSMASLELVLKRARCGADYTLEDPVHVALVGESNLRSHCRETVRICRNHAASGLHAKVLQVFAGRAPRVPAEDARRMHGMHPRRFRQILHSQRFTKIIV